MALSGDPNWLDELSWLDSAKKADGLGSMTAAQQAIADIVRRDMDRFLHPAERETFPVTVNVTSTATSDADREVFMNAVKRELDKTSKSTWAARVDREVEPELRRLSDANKDLTDRVEKLSEQFRDLMARADAQDKQIEELTESLLKSNPNYGRF